MKKENIKKHDISTFYRYAQVQKENNKVEFGWVHSDSNHVKEPVVVTSASKSKNMTDAERKLAEATPKSASPVEDMQRFIDSLVKAKLGGDYSDAEEVWNKFKDSKKEWKSYADAKGISKYDRDIIYKTTALIKGKIKYFRLAGTIYKIVK